jgi:hypothetical protein
MPGDLKKAFKQKAKKPEQNFPCFSPLAIANASFLDRQRQNLPVQKLQE